MKEYLNDRGIPALGTKGMSIERLIKSLNYNMVVVIPKKIATLLTVPKSINSPNSDRTRGPRKGEATIIEEAWNPLELNKTSTTTANNDFASYNATN